MGTGLPSPGAPVVLPLTIGRHKSNLSMFDFWVGLTEGMWKNRGKRIPSGSIPEEVSTHTTALDHTGQPHQSCNTRLTTRGSSIVCDRYFPFTFAKAEAQDQIRILKLLDLMVLTPGIPEN